MKAAVCIRHGASLTIENLVIDPPRKNEVRLQIKACAICHSDVSAIQGEWGSYDLPMVFGHEAAGVVEQVGPDVTGFEVGDTVAVTLVRSCGQCLACRAGHTVSCTGDIVLDRESRLRRKDGQVVGQGLRGGAFAEKCVVHESQIVRISPDVSPVSAALVGCAVITGYGSVTRIAEVRRGSFVVVIGTGGVGMNVIQGALASGAGTILAVDISQPKLEAAQKLGATHVVNPSETNLRERVLTLTAGEGADYVFVAVGDGASIAQALPLLNKFGAAVVLGMPPNNDRVFQVDAHELTAGRRLLGSKMGDACIATDIPAMMALYQRGELKLDELVTSTYPLENINDAICEVVAGNALRNVIVF